MAPLMDDYFKRLLRNYLLRIKHAVEVDDKALAYELADDLIAIFCASVAESYEEGKPPPLHVA